MMPLQKSWEKRSLDWAVGKRKRMNSSIKRSLDNSKLKVLSVKRQCELEEFNRSSRYYTPKPTGGKVLAIINQINETYTTISRSFGYHCMLQQLLEDGHQIWCNKILRL
jgi:hypothetical protein